MHSPRPERATLRRLVLDRMQYSSGNNSKKTPRSLSLTTSLTSSCRPFTIHSLPLFSQAVATSVSEQIRKALPPADPSVAQPAQDFWPSTPTDYRHT